MDGEPHFVPGNNVWTIVRVEVRDSDIDSDTGIVVDEVGDKLDAIRSPDTAEPVEDGWLIAADVLSIVREPALAGDDVLQAVAIHVRESDGMGLGEADAIGVFHRGGPHDVMTGELTGLKLLEPGEPVSVGPDGRDDVRIAVTIDIVDMDLGPAPVTGKDPAVLLPFLRGGAFGGMLVKAGVGTVLGELAKSAGISYLLLGFGVSTMFGDYAGHANAMGAQGIRVTRAAELVPAIESAQRLNADGKTVLIDVRANMEAKKSRWDR